MVFGIGPAGTGKTYLAVAKAVQALQNKQVNRIILTRPAVEAGEHLGFLPGTLNDKIDPYVRPLYDALHDMVDPDSIPRLLTAGTIEVAPLAYMRGRTLNDAFIILDEAQNTSMEQMKMFLTRLGFGSKIVVTGDITQVDLPGGTRSGLRVVQGILDDVDDIAFCHLTNHDVVRHKLVGRIVAAYDKFEADTLTPSGRNRPIHVASRPGRSARPDEPSARPEIEINNESGSEVTTPRPGPAGDLRAGPAPDPSAGRAVHPAGRRGHDERLPREVHGRAGSDRRAVPSRWTSCGRRATTRSRRRACSATSCSARRSPPGRPPSTVGPPRRRRSTCWCTGCCTCSATTTPSRRRRPRCSA